MPCIRRISVRGRFRYFALPLSFSLIALLFITDSCIFRNEADALRLTNQRTEKKRLKTSQYFNYRAEWHGTRTWIGPDWWANPLRDWSIRNGAVISVAEYMRTLCLLKCEINPSRGSQFQMKVNIDFLNRRGGKQNKLSPQVAVGFRIGRKGELDDYRNAIVLARRTFDAKVNYRGNLILGSKISKQNINLFQRPFALMLAAKTLGKFIQLNLTATQGNKRVQLSVMVLRSVITGGISLLSDGAPELFKRARQVRFAFSNFSLKGDLVQCFPSRSFGPILWSQYTLNKGTIRVLAQLAPLDRSHRVTMWVKVSRSRWRKVSTTMTDELSRTAIFRVRNWDSRKRREYEIRTYWRRRNYVWSGIIRSEPNPKKRLKLACFSCDHGYLFPLPRMVAQVERQNPDMLFFAGDQIYEDTGPFLLMRKGPIQVTMLEFLHKYYQFGWTWRNLLRDRPSVILPDDHDVFQGNLFGSGGQRLWSRKPIRWETGGYLMPGPWVNAVERAQMGHLPDPAVNMTLPIGTKARFTSMTYGGVGFAILEDRKFKSAVTDIPIDKRESGGDGDLLGAQQERFLEQWVRDWRGHTMKCALSQTLFAAPKTHNGWKLKRSRYIFDNGAWPRRARDRVVRMLTKGKVFSVHGDQHLGMLTRLGVKTFNDGGFAFMVPGTANGWPRAWWPGLRDDMSPRKGQKFTGKNYDDAGIPLNVLAVANPDPQSVNFRHAFERRLVTATEIGYMKSSGYGLVEFDKVGKRVRVNLYRLPKVGRQNQMFDGFPKIVFVGGKPGERRKLPKGNASVR